MHQNIIRLTTQIRTKLGTKMGPERDPGKMEGSRMVALWPLDLLEGAKRGPNQGPKMEAKGGQELDP